MRRMTISLDEPLAREFEALVARHGYQNRSEAVRDLVRHWMEHERLHGATPTGDCVATVSYVYDHHQRELSRRLTQQQHAHHEMTLSTLHVHLDSDHCLETTVLRGPAAAVKPFADALIAERGVRHGHVHLVPLEPESDAAAHAHPHPHSHPQAHTHTRKRRR